MEVGGGGGGSKYHSEKLPFNFPSHPPQRGAFPPRLYPVIPTASDRWRISPTQSRPIEVWARLETLQSVAIERPNGEWRWRAPSTVDFCLNDDVLWRGTSSLLEGSSSRQT